MRQDRPVASTSRTRRRALRALLAGSALAATGCVSVDIGSDAPSAATQFVLLDRPAATPPRRAQPVAAALLVQVDAGDPIADSLSIAYSRREGERSTYQLAAWSDRPTRRLPHLLLRRFEMRGSFGAVAMLGQPVTSDWLLGIAIDEIVHDVSAEPGLARLVVRASLYDRRERRQVAQRSFRAQTAVGELRPSAVANAMSASLTAVLDELVAWVEGQAEAGRGPGRR